MLLGNVGCLGKVLARCQQELIFGSSAAILTVGPVLFAFKECHGALLRGPFEDHKNLRRLSLAFHPLNDGRASQIPAPAPLNHLGHIPDVVRDPALVRYFDFADDVIFHVGSLCGLRTKSPIACGGRSSDRCFSLHSSLRSLCAVVLAFHSADLLLFLATPFKPSQSLRFPLLNQPVSPPRYSLHRQGP